MRSIGRRRALRTGSFRRRVNDVFIFRRHEVAARGAPLAARDALRLAAAKVEDVLLIAFRAARRRLINQPRPIGAEIRLGIFAAERELPNVLEVLLALDGFLKRLPRGNVERRRPRRRGRRGRRPSTTSSERRS